MNGYDVNILSLGEFIPYLSKNSNLTINTGVVVNTDKGLQYGIIASTYKIVNSNNNILRVATKKDYNKYQKNKEDSLDVIKTSEDFATKLKLDMKFVSSYFSLDRERLYISFTSNNRIDFRDLAKKLAAIYKTRIELRQIGVRDEAKIVSGIGMCGRKLCCSCFLNDMDSVTINMAKNQNLSLNPTKINGLCGRLLCCLKYEDDVYSVNKKDMPKYGDIVKTEFGDGRVTFVDIPRRKFFVDVKDVGKVEMSLVNNYESNK